MQLHFQRQGEGFPLIILHGLFGSLDNWQSLARYWSESFQVFSLDLRNHGRSPHEDAIDYALMAGDVREFMSSQNLSSAHVLGHSMGGKVAMTMALENSDLIKKLIVVDIAPKSYPPSHEPIFQAMFGLDFNSFKERAEIDSALAASITDVPTRQFLLKNIKRNEDGTFEWKMNLPAIYKNYPGIIARLESSKTFKKPTLFIRGGRSDYILEEDYAEIRQSFPAAEIKTIPEAGHWIHAEAPVKFREMVADFLKQN